MGDVSMEFDHPVAIHLLTAFLRTGRQLDNASSVLLLAGLFLLPEFSPLLNGMGFALMLLFAFVEKYFAWRVALDAELFAVLCKYPQKIKEFDVSLATFLGRVHIANTRSMESRWNGAKRFLKYQGFFLALQAAAIVIFAMLAL